MFNRIKAYFFAALSAIVFLAGSIMYQRGKSTAVKDMELDDYENAEDIRRRVSDDRADRVRKLDGQGWRD